ncbi:MAG: protein translocase subunit SecD [Ancrocorticia sp.]
MPSHVPEVSAPKPWRRLTFLTVLMVALVASLVAGSFIGDRSRFLPDFALDLEGGTQIILTPTTTDGSEVTQNDVNQAIEIIRQRVDASGVAEAEIASQGGSNIVVGLPGTPSKETLDLVRTSAVLRMRAVIQNANAGVLTREDFEAATAVTPDTAPVEGETAPVEGTPEMAPVEGEEAATDEAAPVEGEAAPVDEAAAAEGEAPAEGEAAATEGEAAPAEGEAAPVEETAPVAEATPAESAPAAVPFTVEELQAAAMQIADANADGVLSAEPAQAPTDASDLAWVTEKVVYDALTIDCTAPRSHTGEDDPAAPVVACEPDGPAGPAKYILGPAEVEGTQIKQAASGFDQQANRWVVSMDFNTEGAKAFANVTGRLATLESPRNQFAIVLDGQVVSAPSNEQAITGGSAQIFGGSLNQETTKVLANQLNFGSLPLHFEVQSEEQISATLGSESLTSGLIAGLIGMLLVVLYLLWQYHGLGLVASGSVLLATGVSYLLICFLSWTMGYRLSMAGVVGMIISIGVTADSFIVFFERIRDEIREGRTLKAAVAHGWERAKRTIIVADAVNLVCAIVLYFLAVGSVRGFAFTLGLTTLIDLIVVMMFTYPLMLVLTRTKFFGEGKRFSGMDAAALGREPSYRGRGRFESRAPRASKASASQASASQASASTSSAPVAVAENVESEAVSESAPVAVVELSEEEQGLSLAERRALARRKAREAARAAAEGENA